MAIPLEYVPAKPRKRALRLITKQVRERGAIEVVIGLPKHLNGTEGESAHLVREFSSALATMLPDVRLCLVDERRSTVAAKELLHQRGIQEKEQRLLIDSVAAQVILEHALEVERVSAKPPGEEIRVMNLDERGDDEQQ